MIKTFFQENQVDYLVKNIGEGEEARVYVREVLKARGVPTSVIGDKVIIGFKEDELREALGLN